MPVNLLSPIQIKKQIADHAKQRRLEKNLSREGLEKRSGVPASTIKRFETTGNISMQALLMIAVVLDCLTEFSQLFLPHVPISLYNTPKQRERGRQ